MAKLKFTKGELKRQRDSLKQFERYLPTLQLKKQQLQMKILETRRTLASRSKMLNTLVDDAGKWAGLLADESVDVKGWITPEEVTMSATNIAGARVPVFEDVFFQDVKINYYSSPFWIDSGLETMRNIVKLMAEVETIKTQIYILER